MPCSNKLVNNRSVNTYLRVLVNLGTLEQVMVKSVGRRVCLRLSISSNQLAMPLKSHLLSSLWFSAPLMGERSKGGGSQGSCRGPGTAGCGSRASGGCGTMVSGQQGFPDISDSKMVQSVRCGLL